MQTTYDGKHSIIFCNPSVFNDESATFPSGCGPDNFYGGFHSWWTFGLVPASRPFVAPPNQKTSTLEIPGANGLIDLSRVPLGLSTYGERTGSWEFHIAHDVTAETWEKTYDYLMNRLHGKEMAVVLTDDPSYYYYGRITVGSYATDKLASKITINYNLYSYKKMVWTTLGDWLWDPFDFKDGVIDQSFFKDLRTDSYDPNDLDALHITFNSNSLGTEPLTPVIFIEPDDGIVTPFKLVYHSIEVYGDQSKSITPQRYVTLNMGKNDNPQIMFACPEPWSETRVIVAGKGNVSFRFRPGRL